MGSRIDTIEDDVIAKDVSVAKMCMDIGRWMEIGRVSMPRVLVFRCAYEM